MKCAALLARVAISSQSEETDKISGNYRVGID